MLGSDKEVGTFRPARDLRKLSYERMPGSEREVGTLRLDINVDGDLWGLAKEGMLVSELREVGMLCSTIGIYRDLRRSSKEGLLRRA